MKVNNISNNINFYGVKPSFKENNSVSAPIAEQKLSDITPDFSIKTPVNYKLIDINKTENGLDIYNYKLSNGYKVTIVPMEDSPAVVKTYVNVGALNETPNIKGISHFLEHMAFNGTNGENGHIKLNTGDSFKIIDKMGGWANASTNYAITDYVNSSQLLEDKDLETQIKVLSAMTEDLKLSEDMINKEKGPVSSEINMIMDDPQTIAMDQTVRTLYGIKNCADELVGGSVDHIQNLTRKDVMDYYNTYYTPDNTNIVITGNVDPQEAIALVSKNFTSKKFSQGKKFEEKLTPINNTVRKDFICDKATSTEIVLGFLGAGNNNTREKVLFDLAATYITSPAFGLEQALKKYNSYPIIESEKISTNPNANRLGFIMLSTSDANTEKVLSTVFNSLSKEVNIDNNSLENLKKHLRKTNNKSMEYSIAVNDYIGKAVLDNDIEYVTKYNEILDSITPEELNCAVKDIFDINKTAVTVIHPDNEKNISFKSKSKRQPLNTGNISIETLSNNIEAGFYNVKSDDIDLKLRLITKEPYNLKPGVADVLNEIYDMGIGNVISEEELQNIQERDNFRISVTSSPYGITLTTNADTDNYKQGLELGKELLENPAITNENLTKAKDLIKDSLKRTPNNSGYLYSNYFEKSNPYEYTSEEILSFIDSITLDDVKQCHEYLIGNSRGVLSSSVPQNNEVIKNNINNMMSKLPKLRENRYNTYKIYKPQEKTIVLTKENNNSQADIAECFKFKYDNSLRTVACGTLMNSILSNSSIGLFDVLREKDNLAYSVHSNINATGDNGLLTLNILTTTDNKKINEIKYENLQKSIDGFNRQINELIDGKFTDEDLENAKKTMKSDLLNNEGSLNKVSSLCSGMSSKYGANYQNLLYDEIDKITREDIIDFAKYVFSEKPVFAVTASKDTLEYNKKYLDSLIEENNTKF